MTGLQILLLSLGIIFLVKLSFLRSVKFKTSDLTSFELERLAKKGDKLATKEWQREQQLTSLSLLRHVLDSLLSVFLLLCFLGLLGWILGSIVSIIILLEIGNTARIPFVQRKAQKLYTKYEPHVLKIAKKLYPILKYLAKASAEQPVTPKLHSKEELQHLIDQAQDILTLEEQHLLTHCMQFEDKTVAEIMTPRSVVEVIDKKETLGPLVLDRLHKTGHSRFPVIDGTIDRVVGLLYVHNMIASADNLPQIEKLMEARVFYINQNQSLASALAGFLRTHHHLFIVVNEFEETTGVITIEDVIEALIGRKIVDEFDQYQDLRAVASRAAAERNKSGISTHINETHHQ